MANETTADHTNLPGLSSSVVRPVGLGQRSPGPYSPRFETRIIIDLPREDSEAINQLVEETGEDLKEIIQKALALYKATKEAIRQGKVVGIASSEDSLETQFVGL